MYIGIDPGKDGGIAWWWDETMHAERMPDTEKDLADLFADLRVLWGQHYGELKCAALIEKVSSSPQQGVTSAFTFGRGYGFLRGCLISLGIPFEEVRPQQWQKALGCLTGGKKNISKAKAQQLFPSLKITHATADAILICEYNRRLNERK